MVHLVCELIANQSLGAEYLGRQGYRSVNTLLEHMHREHRQGKLCPGTCDR